MRPMASLIPLLLGCISALNISCSRTLAGGDDDAGTTDPGDVALWGDEDLSIGGDAERSCVGPNPTNPNDSGSYCVRHLGGSCFDVVEYHVCVDAVWECPEPDMILTRECTSFRPGEHDVGTRDVGLWDVETPDAEDRDAAGPDANEADAGGGEDADELDVPTFD